MKKLLLLIPVLTLLNGIAMAGEKCVLCGMAVDEGERQYFVITTKDGKKQKACNEGCALIFLENTRDKIKSVEAVDYNTGNLLNAQSAFYVKGSRVRPVMGGESVISFSKREDAERFQKENGGMVVSYDDLFKTEKSGHERHKH